MQERTDYLPILTCFEDGKTAQKIFKLSTEGRIEKTPYNAGTFFTFTETKLQCRHELFEALEELENQPKRLVVRGDCQRRCADFLPRTYEQGNGSFKKQPRRWGMFDIDKIALPEYLSVTDDPYAVIKWVKSLLPKPLSEFECFFQFSSSQNVPSRLGQPVPKTVSVHLWFWFGKYYTDDECKLLAQIFRSPIDVALFNPVQAHYTARPLFVNLLDPLPVRSGRC